MIVNFLFSTSNLNQYFLSSCKAYIIQCTYIYNYLSIHFTWKLFQRMPGLGITAGILTAMFPSTNPMLSSPASTRIKLKALSNNFGSKLIYPFENKRRIVFIFFISSFLWFSNRKFSAVLDFIMEN